MSGCHSIAALFGLDECLAVTAFAALFGLDECWLSQHLLHYITLDKCLAVTAFAALFGLDECLAVTAFASRGWPG